MDVLLISGLWLPASIWSDVVDQLEQLGHRALPVPLPGVDDDSTTATLEDQLEAVLAAVDQTDNPVVVGHSAACTLAWMTADRRAGALTAVALVGGFPASGGERYADFFPVAHGGMPFPGWEPFEGPDAADLDEAARTRIADGAVPVPEAVATGVVTLSDERRFDVPVVMVCPEYDVAQAKEWVASGAVPELSKVKQVSYVDIDSGHWPMVTRPVELARVINAAADSNSELG